MQINSKLTSSGERVFFLSARLQRVQGFERRPAVDDREERSHHACPGAAGFRGSLGPILTPDRRGAH